MIMNISIKDIQLLRKSTGAGMLDCKNALTATNGDLELAKENLRKKGIATSAKKASREANEGLIGIKNKGNIWAILEINSETDFVARNDFFQKFFEHTLDLSLNNPDTKNKDEFLKLSCPWSNNLPLQEVLGEVVGVIKENIQINNFAIIKCADNEQVFHYLHNKVGENLGKIGVLLTLQNNGAEDLKTVGKQICMHIASSSPMSLNIEDLDQKFVQKEREIFMEQMQDSKKPSNIIEKIVEGKLRKLYENHVLLEQNFIMDNNIKIKDLLKNFSIANYYLYKIGS